ncbi:MAG: TIGR01777 family protein [Bacteroidia bacterium]|nr:TIGR01777 family protein [Bacteroidia bacterium]
MKIKITGSNGYLGKRISEALKAHGHHVCGIERKFLYGPPELLMKEIEGAEIIINLAGAPILQRWNEKNKQTISESRVKTTQNLVRAIAALPEARQPKKFISASAIGIYQTGVSHDESSTHFDTGFVGQVVSGWEDATAGLPPSVEKIIFRIGLVLGKEAKTITNLLIPFKLGLGAAIGNGQQPFPFIHEKDVARAFLWAVDDYRSGGVFNLVALQTINHKQFTNELARQLHRPAFFKIPVFILKLVLGDASVLLTESPEVVPLNLKEAGFLFLYPDIESALKEIIVNKT